MGHSGHGDAHGHADAHADAHGHAAVADPHDAHAAGPVELPAAPAERSITPAPEDFRNLPGPGALLWPVVWIGAGALLLVLLLKGGWPAFHDEHAAGHAGAAPGANGSPGRGLPEPGLPGHGPAEPHDAAPHGR